MKKLLSISVFALGAVLISSLSWAGEDNLLENGSAETGDLSGWETLKGGFAAIDKPADGTYPGPVQGKYYFFAGKYPVSLMEQSIELPRHEAEQVVTFSGNLHGYGNDYIEVSLCVLDAGGHLMSEGSTGSIQEKRWSTCRFSAVVPLGAESLRLRLSAVRKEGRDNDGYADNMSVTLQPVQQYAQEAEADLGPALVVPGLKSVHVWWSLKTEQSDHYVELDSPGSREIRFHLKYWTKTPFIKLDNLVPGRTYTYRVCSGLFKSRPYSFSIKDPADNFRVGIWGDNQNGIDTFTKQTVPALDRLNADVLLSLGDVVQNGDRPGEWEHQLYKPAASLLRAIPWFPVRGNHDGESRLALSMIPLPRGKGYYSAQLGPARLIVLDSNISLASGSEQNTWLAEELKKKEWKEAPCRIVSVHEPPFTNLWDSRDYSGTPQVRGIVPLLENGKADLVLCGHVHGYERGERTRPDGNKTHYLTLGGGGGKPDNVKMNNWPHISRTLSVHHIGVMDISGKTVEIRIIGTDTGKVIDTLTIKHGKRIQQ